MFLTELLAESLSRVAYHYTNTLAALKILKSGEFQLSSALGSIEQQYMPRGRPYFMSTTRTRIGGYHQGGMRRGVLFVLDGNWFNQRYKSGPIDYWGNRGTGMRASEAEDRVYSAEPTIPIGGVTAVHVFLNVKQDDAEQQAHDQSIVREILIAAKTRGIAAYFYDRHDAWLALDTRHTADVSQLTGTRKPAWYRPKRARTYMQAWIELMSAKAQNQLSKEADKMRYSLNYTYDLQDAVQALNNDMSNARKPDSGHEREDAVKIISYMRQHKLNTIKDFVEHIAAKWKAIAKIPTKVAAEGTEQVDELFEPKSAFNIEYEKHHDTLYATAYDEQGRTLSINLVPSSIPDTVDIEFQRGGSYDISGAGQAERVFGTVLEVVRKYLSTTSPAPEYFTFFSKEGSRTSLYGAMIKRYARSFGYQAIDPHNPPEELDGYITNPEGMFLLQRIK